MRRNRLEKLIERKVDEKLQINEESIKSLKDSVESIKESIKGEKEYIAEIKAVKVNMPLEVFIYNKQWNTMMDNGLRVLSKYTGERRDREPIPYFTKTLISDRGYFCENGFVFGALKIISGNGDFDLETGREKITHLNFIRGDKYIIFPAPIVLEPDVYFGLKSNDSKVKLKYSLVGAISNEFPDIQEEKTETKVKK